MVYIDVLGLVCKETCSILIPENTRVVSVTPPETQRCRSTLWFFFDAPGGVQSHWHHQSGWWNISRPCHGEKTHRQRLRPLTNLSTHLKTLWYNQLAQLATRRNLQCNVACNIIYIYIYGYSSCLKPSGLLTPFMPGFCSCLSFGSISRSDTVELFWTTEVVLHPTTSFWNWCHPKIMCFLWGTWRVPF